MATITERLELLIDAKTGGAVSGLRAVTAETKAMGDTQTKATGVTGLMERGLGKLGISSEAAGTALKTGVTVAVVAAAAAMVKFGKDSVAATVAVESGIRKVQEVTGASAETSSKLVAITDDYGISSEAAAKSFGKLSVNIANGKSTFDDLGIATKDAQGKTRDFESVLLDVADAYEQSGGGAAGLKIVTDAFGKSGKDLIPILEQGRSGIKAMFDAVPDRQIFGQKNLDDARDYQLAMDNLQDAARELQFTLGKALIPVLTDVANGLATVTRAAVGANDAIKDLTGVSFIDSFAKSLTLGFTLVGSLGDALGLGAKKHNEFAEASEKSAEANKKVADLAAAGKQGTEEYATAQKDARGAADELAGAQNRVGKALEDTIPKTEQAKTKAEELATANYAALEASNALANAQLGVQGAVLNVESALAAQAKTLEDNTADSLEAREAQLKLDQSLLGVATAAGVQYEEQVKLAGGTANALDKHNAEVAALEALKAKFPQLSPEIQGHIDRLNQIPYEKPTNAKFTGNFGDVQAYLNKLYQIKTEIATIQANNPEAFFSHGGWVQGTGTGDSVRAMLSPGEFVISKAMLSGLAPIPPSLGSRLGGGSGGGSVTVGGGGSMTVQLVLDGQVLGQASVDYINRQASRGPGPLVQGATAA